MGDYLHERVMDSAVPPLIGASARFLAAGIPLCWLGARPPWPRRIPLRVMPATLAAGTDNPGEVAVSPAGLLSAYP